MIGNVTWDDLLFPLHQINKKCENVILYAKNYLADKTDQNLNKRYHLFKNCIAEIEDMARKEIEKGLVLKYSISNNWSFDDTVSTPTIVETNFERQWTSAKRGMNNDGFDYISELYEKFEEEKTYYKLQMQVNGYEIDHNTISLGVIAPQQLVDVEPKVATDKSYFEKSKKILAFIRSCENIPDDQNPLYDDIVEDRLRGMDKLPTLDDLEVEYFEHTKAIGQDSARDYITGLWTNTAPAPSLEYLYVADNRLRCIGLVWAKLIQDMVMFFNRIGVSEINLYNEDVALELLDKLSSLETESSVEDKTPNIEAKKDAQINKDELLKCFNFKFNNDDDKKSRLIKYLQESKSNKEYARAALLIQESEKVLITKWKNKAFTKWCKHFCNIVGCKYIAGYNPKKLRDSDYEHLQNILFYITT